MRNEREIKSDFLVSLGITRQQVSRAMFTRTYESTKRANVCVLASCARAHEQIKRLRDQNARFFLCALPHHASVQDCASKRNASCTIGREPHRWMSISDARLTFSCFFFYQLLDSLFTAALCDRSQHEENRKRKTIATGYIRLLILVPSLRHLIGNDHR